MKFKKLIAGICVLSILTLTAACATPTLSPDHDLVADMYKDIDLESYITLGQYTDIIIETRDPAATEEEIEEFFDSFLDSNSTTTKVTDRTEVLNGDILKIDYEGTVNGEALSNMADTDATLQIGSNSFIPGFEEALIGAQLGDTVTFDITFPEDYWSASMRGVEATFKVKINEIYIKELPELTDELVASKTNYTTVSEYREYVREQITQSNQETIDDDFEYNVWIAVLDNATISTYPQDMIDDFKKTSEESIEAAATQYGMTLEEYVAACGYTMDEFYATVDENAHSRTKEYLVLYLLSKTENITITWAEYQELAKEYMESLYADTLEDLESRYDRGDLVRSMVFDKIMELLMSTAKTEIKK